MGTWGVAAACACACAACAWACAAFPIAAIHANIGFAISAAIGLAAGVGGAGGGVGAAAVPMDPANAAIAAAYALASNTGAAGAGSLAPSTAALTAWNAPPGLSALSASAAASAPSAVASPLPLPLVMLCSRPEMRGDLSRIVSGLSLDGVPGVSPSDSVVAASSSPSMPLLFARFLIMPKAIPPLLSEPLPPLPYPDLDPSDRRRTALSLPTLRCALLLGSVMRTSRVFLTVSSLRLASAAPPSPGPSSAWMMLSSFFT